MAEGTANRIEVDLKLLQDSNLAALKDFGSAFETAVDKLIKGFGSYVEQFAAAVTVASGGQVGKASPGASVAQPLMARFAAQAKAGANLGISTALSEGSVSGPGGIIPPGGGAGQASDNASKATPLPSTGLGRFSFARPELPEYAKAQFQLGQVPSDLEGRLRYISHYAGTGGWTESGQQIGNGPGQVPVTTGFAQGLRTTIAPTARQISGGIGFVASGVTMGKQISSAAQDVVQTGSGMADEYAGLGYSPIGKVGLPFTSPAFGYGLEQDWKAGLASWFGLNPNLSLGEASAIRSAIAGQGFTNDTADAMATALNNIQVNTGINNPQLMASMADSSTRFGQEDLTSFTNQIYAIRTAAQAASIPMASLAEQIDATATSLNQSTGVPYTTLTSALTAFTAASGMAPSVGEQALTFNLPNYMLAQAINTQEGHPLPGPTSTQTSPYLASDMTNVQMHFAQQLMGGIPITQWAQAKAEGNTTALGRTFLAHYNSPAWLALQNTPLLGGLSVQQLSIMGAKNFPGMEMGTENVQAAQERLSNYQLLAKINPQVAAKNTSMLDVNYGNLLAGTNLSPQALKTLKWDISNQGKGLTGQLNLGKYSGNWNYGAEIMTKQGQEQNYAAFNAAAKKVGVSGSALKTDQQAYLEQRDQKIYAVMNTFFKNQEKTTQAQKNEITLEFTPFARKILQQLIQPGDKSTANTAKAFGEQATHHSTHWYDNLGHDFSTGSLLP